MLILNKFKLKMNIQKYFDVKYEYGSVKFYEKCLYEKFILKSHSEDLKKNRDL